MAEEKLQVSVSNRNSVYMNTRFLKAEIRINEGSLLDIQLFEILSECLDRGVKTIDIMNALNSLKK